MGCTSSFSLYIHSIVERLVKKMKRKTTPLTLPEDLIIEILLRLPVRSLLRFKCVCKSWLSLISDPQFAKSHFDIAAAPTNRLVLKFYDGSEVNSVDIEAPLNNDSANVVFSTSLPSLVTKYQCCAAIVGSCRGFILLTYENSFLFDFIVWNPSTGLSKQINNMWTYPYLCGIGYDSSTDDYVVVKVTLRRCTKVECFSLRTNSWSCIELTVEYHCRAAFCHGLFLNGAIHWLAISNNNIGVIIAFDVMERRLSEISLPHDATVGFESKLYRLRVVGGCLCICSEGYLAAMPEMWTMKEYRVHSSWTKSSFVVSANYYHRFSIFSPICFTKNGKIWGSDNKETLVRLNGKGELLEHRTYRRRVMGRFNCLLQYGMYRESLLTLPRGI